MQKYRRWHDEIIARARGRKLNCYFELHHIEPRSLGGSDDASNLVELTYREHFLVHWLLTKIVREGCGRRAMLRALHCMGTMSPASQRIIASWQYEIAKRALFDEFYEDRWRDGNVAKVLKSKRLNDHTIGRIKYSEAEIQNWENNLETEVRQLFDELHPNQHPRMKTCTRGKRKWVIPQTKDDWLKLRLKLLFAKDKRAQQQML